MKHQQISLFNRYRKVNLVYRIPYWTSIPNHSDLEERMNDAEEQLFSYPQLALELYFLLFNGTHSALEIPQPLEEARWASLLHSSRKDHSRWLELEEMTRDNHFLACEAIARMFYEIADKIYPQTPLAKDPQILREQVMANRNLIRLIQTGAIKTRDDAAEIGRLTQTVNEQVMEGAKYISEFSNFANSLDSHKLKTLWDSVIPRVISEIKALIESLENLIFPLSGDDIKGGNIKDKMLAAKTISQSEKLRQISIEAGRMRLRAQQKRATRVPGTSKPKSIERGNDLRRLVPTEYFRLTSPLQPFFLRDYGNRKLMQFKMTSTEKLTKGPIIVCIDSSGSMRGEKEIWSKALALTLGTIASSQKRDFQFIHFNSLVKRVDDFRVGQVDVPTLLASLESFFSGGTSWEAPLSKAMEAIAAKSHLKKADIILITDGMCQLPNEFKFRLSRLKKQHCFTIYTIVIGVATSEAYKAAVAPDVAFSDKLAWVSCPQEDSEAEVVFDVGID